MDSIPQRRLAKPSRTAETIRYPSVVGDARSETASDDEYDTGGENDNYLDIYSEERRLDGSRDYWQFDEDGKFGSHPSFDDYDEADP